MESHSLVQRFSIVFWEAQKGLFSGHSGNIDGHHWGICTLLLAWWEVVSEKAN